jgi:hypothetical protein
MHSAETTTCKEFQRKKIVRISIVVKKSRSN